MDYPIWHIPALSKGLFMALISVTHVFVAQFAVGGGLYLVWMERKAQGSPEILAWLRRHTMFFLLLTMVFGGLSGVGIWVTMSVISPAGTSALIHTFLWVWAAEWVFFLVEIVALLIYYYSYQHRLDGRMSPQSHLNVGYIYAVSGWMSLFLINGVICFMLTPGQGLESSSLGLAFFNPTSWPSLFYRTALSMLLAGMFALFTASRIAGAEARRRVIRQSSLWICLPFLALLAASAWYFMALPPDRQAAVLRRTADIHPFLLAYGWALPVIFLLGVWAYARAEKLRRPLTVLILCSGLVLAGSYEWLREAGRRPWIIPDFIYSSTVRPKEGEFMNRRGMAAVSGWLRMYDGAREGEPDFAVQRGALIFAAQCGTCHGVGGPKLDIIPRIRGLTHYGLLAQIDGNGVASPYMPPFFGDKADRETLAVYLNNLAEE